MKETFLEELRWRGLLQQHTPNFEYLLTLPEQKAYIGFDPTAESLTIGNLVTVMLLKFWQKHGHTAIVVLGGATGRIGDPSGKQEERNLLDISTINQNIQKQQQQFVHLLGEDILLLDNFQWYKDMNTLMFLRDIGKYLTVNYMSAKDSVTSRIDTGMSFTEFSYQLLQAYDFNFLYNNYGCNIQFGGADQWGNMTSGMDLIRKMSGGNVGVLTCPLLTKSDGNKFGKSETGNIWLDKTMTSPYKFYQFFLNTSDEDAVRFIKIFTLLDQASINIVIQQQQLAPHLRILQKTLAQHITELVHNRAMRITAEKTTELLFGKVTTEMILHLTICDLQSLSSEIPMKVMNISTLPINVVDILVVNNFISSKTEAKKHIQNAAITINQHKILDNTRMIDNTWLLFDKYILLRFGKKQFGIIDVVQ